MPMRPAGAPAPDWLGTRDLPLRPDEFGEIQPTPPELVDRRLWTDDMLPPPPDDRFHITIEHPPPAEVLARSTYRDECPVTADELAYLTVSFFGFDGLFHTGELLVHADWADELAGVFEGLHAQRFPIEEMRVVTQAEQDAHPTGDGNNTSAFVCRTAVDPTRWSRHASGLAVDINPFHNPYVKDDLVLPELASAYVDRSDVRPGMIGPDQVALFAELGWGWGGNWNTLLDHMHFSDNNR
ncbi:MAG: M15 family metallopeptidase [Acidimicrobiales bacterium]|nr:M15 family metallopeptidase [Acidimicrobiales bacterium]